MGHARGIEPARAGRWRSAFAALALLVALAGTAGVSGAEQEPDPPQLPILLLNGAIYTQAYDAGALPASFRVEGYPADTTALYLLQCRGPIREVWVEDLRRIGGEPRGYLPYNTLLVGMDGEARSRLGELDFVDWHGLYQPYFKVSPALQLRLSQGGEVTAVVEVFSARLLQETLEELQELPVQVVGSEAGSWGAVVALRMPVEAMSSVAALPGVEWMELCTAGTLPAVRGGLKAARDAAEALAQAADAGGGVVALCDTGLGTGGPQGIPSALAGKVLSLTSLRGDDGADPNGHGTAVAGCIGGAGRGEGAVAPYASPAMMVYATGYGLGGPPLPLSLYALMEKAYTEGARVFLAGSVPEGKESLGAYGVFSFQRDALVWDNPLMALVEAAGNEGTDADGDGVVDRGSLLGGAAAKNVLSVGGCESPAGAQRDGDPLRYSELEKTFTGSFPSSPLREDSSVGAPHGMAAFSSRGPTRDGRIKPDLVAPATDILTLASGSSAPAQALVPSRAAGRVRAYGTSLAAARAAAELASMRLPLTGIRGTEPSAALLKAFLVNGAEEMAPGQYGDKSPEIPPAPNAVEGWGRLDPASFQLVGSWAKVLDDAEGMRLGEARVYRVEVAAGKELRVTLAWSDYPSLPEARLHLVNDLDLKVIGPDGNVYYPNGRSSRDPLNNVERVVVEVSGRPGVYRVEIDAWNVPFSPQPFALVAQVL